MAVSAGVGFDIDDFGLLMQKAKEADKALEGVVNRMESLSKVRISGDITQYLERLKEVGNLAEGLSRNPLSIDIDVTKLKEGKNAIDQIVGSVNNLMSMNFDGSLEFFDTQKLYMTDKPLSEIEKELGKINAQMAEAKKRIADIDAANETIANYPAKIEKLQQKLDAPFKSKHKEGTEAYNEAFQEHLAGLQKEILAVKKQYKDAQKLLEKESMLPDPNAERERLIELQAIWNSYYSNASKPKDVQRRMAEQYESQEYKAEEARIKAIIAEQKKLLDERKKIEAEIARYDKAEGKGKKLSTAEQDAKLDWEIKLEEINKQIEAKERAHQEILKDIEEKGAKERLEIIENLEKRAYSKDEALSLANKATSPTGTGAELKEALRALESAKYNDTMIGDTDAIEELNKAIVKVRGELEKLQEVTQKENKLQPSLRNEYSRTVAEIEKLEAQLKKLDETQQEEMSLTGVATDFSTERAAITARLQTLNDEKLRLEAEANGLLAEEQKKHEAEKTRIAIEEYKKRVEELKAYEKKYGTISASDAQDVIANTQGAANVRQAQKAIEDLTEARAKLNRNDANYENTLESLNAEIKRHEDYIQSVTNAEKHRAEQERQYRETYDGARDYARQAKSLNDLKKAMDYLEKARAKEDVGSEKYQELTIILNNTRRRYEEFAGTVQRSSRGLINTADQLKRSFALLFSVSQVRGYVRQLMEVRGEFELQQRSLQALLQNKEEADQLWNKTVALAVQSPFRVKELVTYTKQLAAYRFESDKLYDTTKMLADVSSGLGVDMQRLILAYGQVRSASYLRGTELRQFTEAGVPLLKELADRFTDLEGRAVSVGDVFERISKRMVTFEDVEAVFRKMTSEGEMFYMMQEKQSETLQGQISNLRDSIDLMLNDIGKSTEGALKGSISVVRSLVENWQVMAGALKGVAAALVVYKVNAMLTDKALMRFAISQGTVMRGSTRLTKVLGLATAGFKKMFLALKSGLAINPWLLALSALLKVIMDSVSWFNRFDEALAEQNQRYYDQIAAVNKVTKAYDALIAAEKKEGANAEEIFAKKQKQLNELQKIAEERGIELSFELGEIDQENIDAIVEQIREDIIWAEDWGREFGLNLARGLNAVEGWFHIFGDNLATDLEELDEAMGKINRQGTKTTLANAENEILARYDELPDKAKEYFDVLREGRKENESEQAFLERRINTLSYISQLISLNGLAGLKNAKELGKAYDNLAKIARKRKEVEDELTDVVEDQLEAYGVKDFSHLTTDQQANVQLQIDKKFSDMQISDELKRWGAMFMAQEFQINYVVAPKSEETKDLLPWQEKYNEYIKTLSEETRKAGVLAITDYQTERAKQAKKLKEIVEENEKIIKAKETGAQEITDEDVRRAKLIAEEARKAQVWLVGTSEDKKTEEEDPILKQLKERIKLIQEMNREYEKLRKDMGVEDAWKKVRDSYENTFNELELDKVFKFGITGLDFDDAGTVVSLEKLVEQAQYAGKTYSLELQKTLDNYKVEKDIELKVEKREQLQSKVDELFDRVDLSNELKKLGFTQDLASSFGFDFIDLEQVKTQVRGMKAQFEATGTEGEKEYQKYLDKITDLENKAARERMKTYSKYLLEGMSERVKLKIEEMRKLKEIEEADEFTPEQKERITQGVNAETRKALQKQEWEDFKGSEMYTMMFEDLENYGTKALELLRDKIELLKGSLSDLDATEVKEIISQLNKIDDVIIARKPGAALHNIRQQLADRGVGTSDEETKALETAESIEKNAQEEIDLIHRVQAARQQNLTLTIEDEAAYASLLDTQYGSVEAEQEILDANKEIVDSAQDEQAKRRKNLNLLNQEKQAQIAKLNKANEYLDVVGRGLQAGKELLETVTGETDGVGSAIADAGIGMLSLIQSAITMQAQFIATGIAANSALGIIGWIAIALEAVVMLLSAIFSAKDKALEKQMEEHLATVERLQEAYDKLETAIDEAYSTKQLERYARETQKLTAELIRAQEAAIAANKARKQTDEVREQTAEMEKELAALKEQEKETLEDLFSSATDGILDSVADAARDFVDAWYDAFKETGDGLNGLEENFKETMINMLKQQAALQIVGPYVADWVEDLKKYINPEKGDTTLTKEEAKAWFAEVEKEFPEISAALENLYSGIKGWEKEVEGGELSALQKGIQGATAEQAEVISSYLNSTRLYVATNGEELKKQTTILNNIYTLLNSMTTSDTQFSAKAWKTSMK